jgi:hypothetical protein
VGIADHRPHRTSAATQCQICVGPDREAIDKELRTGTSIWKVAKDHGLSRDEHHPSRIATEYEPAITA